MEVRKELKDKVNKACKDSYGITSKELFNGAKTDYLCLRRYVVYEWLKIEEGMTWASIGRLVNKSRTSVYAGVEKASELQFLKDEAYLKAKEEFKNPNIKRVDAEDYAKSLKLDYKTYNLVVNAFKEGLNQRI